MTEYVCMKTQTPCTNILTHTHTQITITISVNAMHASIKPSLQRYDLNIIEMEVSLVQCLKRVFMISKTRDPDYFHLVAPQSS